jgi:hypothetical protein
MGQAAQAIRKTNVCLRCCTCRALLSVAQHLSAAREKSELSLSQIFDYSTRQRPGSDQAPRKVAVLALGWRCFEGNNNNLFLQHMLLSFLHDSVSSCADSRVRV